LKHFPWIPDLCSASPGISNGKNRKKQNYCSREVSLLDVDPVKVEEPEYRSLSYSMENDLIANAPAECEPR